MAMRCFGATSSFAGVTFVRAALALLAGGCSRAPGGRSQDGDAGPVQLQPAFPRGPTDGASDGDSLDAEDDPDPMPDMSPDGATDAASDAPRLDAALDAPWVADASPDAPPDAASDAAAEDAGGDGPSCSPLAWEVLPTPCGLDYAVYPDAVACAPYTAWAPMFAPYIFRDEACFEASFASCPEFLDGPAADIDFATYDVVEVCMEGQCGAACYWAVEITDVRLCADAFGTNVIVADATQTVPCGSCTDIIATCHFVLIPETGAAATDLNPSCDDCATGCCPSP